MCRKVTCDDVFKPYAMLAQVWAQAYDNPIPGFETKTVGNLRLFEALPDNELDLEEFNKGEFGKVPSLICLPSPHLLSSSPPLFPLFSSLPAQVPQLSHGAKQRKQSQHLLFKRNL
jgi:hypothetical protein